MTGKSRFVQESRMAVLREVFFVTLSKQQRNQMHAVVPGERNNGVDTDTIMQMWLELRVTA
eukprot:scaffold4298_cov166-Skeletonema_marinoi.AAC.7